MVELVPRAELEACDANLLSSATKAAFGQRRKMLRQSLKPFAASLGIDASELLEAAGIETTRRAEEVDVPGFVSLAQAAQRLRLTR